MVLLIFIAWLDINGFLVGFDGGFFEGAWGFNRAREYNQDFVNTVKIS
jgi:hypothetical protein